MPAAMAVRGIEGIVEGLDYRGVRVLAAVKAIPDSPWYLIAKVDQEEIYAPIREQGKYVLILVGVLIGAAGVSIGFFWRRQVAQFYRKQYEEELERRALAEHYEFLKKYANDIILLYNDELRIIEANDRAVESYGYPYEELLQLDASLLRPPETKSSLGATKKEVEEKKSLVFETIHQRKDGTTFPVEVSVRIIEVEGKRFHQSIIRDITERKQAEEERGKLVHDLQEALSRVKSLSGLLPICASCKKIRDDKGYWNQIESYIHDHSEADFSHSICPECARKLYPELYEDEKEEKT
jgi:PAS domain S-box-containing protein